MFSFLNPESKFMLAMSRIGDLLLLNLMFLISCVPIITIGAASTAMYTLCFRFDTDRERGLIKSYFIAFKDNFKQATILWLIILLCGSTACINVYIFYIMSGVIPFLYVVFLILLVLVVLIAGYTFPLVSQFQNGNMATLKNALILSLGYLPRSILVAVLNLFPFGLLLFDFYLFLNAAFLWALIYFAAAAYLNSVILKKVFAPYMPEEEPIEEDEA